MVLKVKAVMIRLLRIPAWNERKEAYMTVFVNFWSLFDRKFAHTCNHGRLYFDHLSACLSVYCRPMTYFKGTDRAIYYAVDTQRLGQYNIFIALWSLQNCTTGCFQY